MKKLLLLLAVISLFTYSCNDDDYTPDVDIVNPSLLGKPQPDGYNYNCSGLITATLKNNTSVNIQGRIIVSIQIKEGVSTYLKSNTLSIPANKSIELNNFELKEEEEIMQIAQCEYINNNSYKKDYVFSKTK